MSADSPIDFSMIDLFRGEAQTQLAALSQGLVALEEDAADPKRIEPLMRAAHSLKGAARIINLDFVVGLAHLAEDVFVAAQEGKVRLDPAAIDLVLRAVDLLGQTATVADADFPAWLSGHEPERRQLEEQLRALRDGAAPPSAAPAPAPTAPIPASSSSLENLSMLDLFQSELAGQEIVLRRGLAELDARPGDAALLATLNRAAHSLKGAARIVNLETLVRLGLALETAFAAARERSIPVAAAARALFREALDVVFELRAQTEAGLAGWLAARTPLLESFAARIEALSATAPAQAAAPATPPAATAAAPAAKAAPAEAADRTVKLTAESLNRLMSLGAEMLVEARQLQPFADTLLRLKTLQTHVQGMLTDIREAAEGSGAPPHLLALIQETQNRFNDCRRELADRLHDFEILTRRSTNLSDRLYREIVSSRMRPFSDGAQGFPRLVRDLARQLGKKARLNIVGRATQVDRDILEKLEAPLGHILNNALDHGLEMPNERARAGKPEEGAVTVEARHRAGMLLITVQEDGRGVDLDRLREKVVEKGLAAAEMVGKLSEAELLEFLFLPGFSTAKRVTEVSGRGVGLDVVQSMVHANGGNVRVTTQAGQGTCFHLQLPITRSVLRALLVRIAGEVYALPLARIDRALCVPHSEIKSAEGRHFVTVQGQHVGLVSAALVLELDETAPPAEEIPIVIVSDRTNRYGLEVEALLGERDMVVRPLDPRLGKIPDLASTSLLEDGGPVLILDVDDMVRSIDKLLSGGNLSRSQRRDAAREEKRTRQRILVVDDSITVREVERKLLEAHGYEVEVAVDGMEGWNAVRLNDYDMILSDVDMPRMNGIEFVRHIKQDPRLKALRVMIVSYKDREEDRLRGMEAGADFYLAKGSFQDDTLINAVRSLIGEPGE